MTDLQTRTVEFTVAALKAPDGKKPGSVKTDRGNWINVWEGEYPRFRKGVKYRAVVYNKPYQGKDQWTVSALNKGGRIDETGAQKPPSGNGGSHAEAHEFPEPVLRFVSNVVASAVTAGALKTPGDISVWAKAAFATFTDLASVHAHGIQPKQEEPPPPSSPEEYGDIGETF